MDAYHYHHHLNLSRAPCTLYGWYVNYIYLRSAPHTLTIEDVLNIFIQFLLISYSYDPVWGTNTHNMI